MNGKQKFWYFGVWFFPISLFLWICAYSLLKRYDLDSALILLMIMLVLVIPIPCIWMTHRYHYNHYYRDDFSPKAQHDWRQLGLSKDKLKALYKPPNRRNIFRQPTGMVLAKTRKQYVCVPIDPHNLMNGCIIGSPGSGKSSGPLISTLAWNFSTSHPITCYVIDIKGELHNTCVRNDDPNVRIIDPDDPTAAGWDPWYNITQSSADDDILDNLDKAARAIIIETNERNAFFSNSARKIFKGAMLYYFRKQVWTNNQNQIKEGFADAIIELQSRDTVDLIKAIVADREICDKHPQIDTLLGGFTNAESEALNGIKLSLQERLEVFALDSVHHMLDVHNPIRTSPYDLFSGKSIFLSFKENRLETMQTLFRFITYTVLAEMENKPENTGEVLALIDEFPRLGKIDRILTSLATLRGRGFTCWIAIQDFSQIISVYGKDQARIILNLCEVCCVLNCRDAETGKLLEEWSGKYDQRKESHTQNAVSRIRSGIETISTERRPVVEIADMMRLRSEKGIALWIEGEYGRAMRLRYFEDDILNPIVQNIVQYNNSLKLNHIVNKQDSYEEILFFDTAPIDEDEEVDHSHLTEYLILLQNKTH